MRTASVPRYFRAGALVHALHDAGALQGDWTELAIDIPDSGRTDCSAMAFLCAWGLLQARAGRRLHLQGDAGVVAYLARMDLHAHLGLPYKDVVRYTEAGRFIPLKCITGEDDVPAAVYAVCDLVAHRLDDARSFVPALEWALYEIIDNILIHAQAEVPGVLCAQYLPHQHRLDVAICDMGQGIKASLGSSRTLASHGEAVTMALQRGVTRDTSVGQGNGLAGALEITRRNHGSFRVWSGDAVYRLKRGEDAGVRAIPAVPGTGVLFSLDTRHPVDLTETWIAGNGKSCIDSMFLASAAADAGERGIDVAGECVSTGSRPPATGLRRKILALLPDMEEPLVLDFTRVPRASSSFLDELLGRLAQALGLQEFERRVRITGMDPLVHRLANVVIAQRLNGLDVPDDLEPPGPPDSPDAGPNTD